MIVDANPIVSACLGRSRPLFEALVAAGIDLYVPEHQMREARLIATSRARLADIDPTAILAWTAETLRPVAAEVYLAFEPAARDRLGPGGQKDWPLVALALASGDAVWSNDVDLFGTGIIVWNTHNIGKVRPRSPVA